MTSGFNIISDLTRDRRFNEMMGFTRDELIKIMSSQEIDKEEQEKLLPIMEENYDGYRFSKDVETKLYNSNMCLYFLNSYIAFGKIPEELVDTNIASDYSKIGNMLRLCRNENRLDIIEKTISGEGIATTLVRQFNPEKKFWRNRNVINVILFRIFNNIRRRYRNPILKIPNQVIKEIYAEYFLKVLREDIDLDIDVNYNEISREILKEGKIDRIIELLGEYLSGLSNRDYQNFDEKYVKIMLYCIARTTKKFIVKSEYELGRGYSDILLLPKDLNNDYYSVMIEFKYLKKDEENKLKEKQEEAKEQIKRYSNLEEVQVLKNIRKYTVIAVVDKLYIKEV